MSVAARAETLAFRMASARRYILLKRGSQIISISESPVHYRIGKTEAARNYVRIQYDCALHVDFLKAYVYTQPGQRADNANVTPCDGTDSSEQWCCGNSTACCGGDSSFGSHSVAPVFLGVVTSSSSSSVASSTSVSIPLSSSSSSSTPTPSPTTTPPPNDDSGGLPTGMKAGIGVGAAFGVIALIALGAFIGRRSHKKKEEATEATTYYEPFRAEFPSETYRHEAPNQDGSMYEAPVTQKPAELHGVPIKSEELPGPGR